MGYQLLHHFQFDQYLDYHLVQTHNNYHDDRKGEVLRFINKLIQCKQGLKSD